MEKRYAVVADPHLGIFKDSSIWHAVTVRLFQSMADVCIKGDIDTIIILGDFFDERKFLNIKTLDTALKIAGIIKDFKVFLIIGNHDAYFKDRLLPTSLGIFSKHPNITVIDQPTELEDMLLVPWGYKPEAQWGRYKVVLGHFEINGFPANDYYIFKSNNSLDAEAFESCNQVISGHFHCPSRKDNIRYIGSPYQMSFGDTSGGARGFFILEDNKLETIEFKEAPKFVKLRSDVRPTEEMIKGNIVKLIYVKDYGKIQNNRLLETVQLLKPLQLHTDFAKLSNDMVKERTDETIVLKNNQEILYEFIDRSTLPTHIKSSTLKNIIEKLMRDGDEEEE